MRIVFLGTPPFAVPSLEGLVSAGHDVLAVYTQPDRPKGRGNQLAESAVKVSATRLQLPVFQPERIRRPEVIGPLRDLRADLMVVVGYGQIIPQTIIDLPEHGILNVHGSLLPKYRGAAPIQWSIANGETQTGVTIMKIDAGLDTGDMLLRSALAIRPDETSPLLGERLAVLGASRLLEAIGDIAAGRSRPEKQVESEATYAPILKKEDGRVRWSSRADEIYNRLRGFTPWPGAFSAFRENVVAFLKVRPVTGSSLTPGEITVENRRLLVGCRGGTLLEILELQPSGKKPMPAEAFINGYQPRSGESFASFETPETNQNRTEQ